MSPDPDFHPSADAWLDGRATTGQGKVLQEIVEKSPAAAREFANLARTQAALELSSHTAAQRLDHAAKLLRPTLRQKARSTWAHPASKWTATSAAAALVIGVAWWMQSSPVASLDSGMAARSTRPKTLTVSPLQVHPENLPPPDAAYTLRMEHFIIPEFTAQGMDLGESIALLTDKVTGMGEGAYFKVTMTEPAPGRVFLNLKYQPAATLLHLIALQTGLKVQASGQTYHLLPDKDLDPDDIDYRLVDAARWQAFSQSQQPLPSPTGGVVGHVAGRGLEPPPVARAEADPLPEMEQLSAVLLNAVGESPKSVKPWQPTDNTQAPQLVNVGSSHRLNAMLALLLAGDKAPGTLTYEVKWVKLPSHAMTERVLSDYRMPEEITAGNGAIRFSAASMQRLLADLVSDPTVKIESAPPLRVVPGRGVSVVSTIKSPADPAMVDQPSQFCKITSLPMGSRTTFEIMIETATLATNGGVAVQRLNNRSTMDVGHTQFFGGPMDGAAASVALVTARAAGDIPYGIPVAGKPGYVSSPYALEKGQVDVADIPAGTKVRCPYSGEVFRIP